MAFRFSAPYRRPTTLKEQAQLVPAPALTDEMDAFGYPLTPFQITIRKGREIVEQIMSRPLAEAQTLVQEHQYQFCPGDETHPPTYQEAAARKIEYIEKDGKIFKARVATDEVWKTDWMAAQKDEEREMREDLQHGRFLALEVRGKTLEEARHILDAAGYQLRVITKNSVETLEFSYRRVNLRLTGEENDPEHQMVVHAWTDADDDDGAERMVDLDDDL